MTLTVLPVRRFASDDLAEMRRIADVDIEYLQPSRFDAEELIRLAPTADVLLGEPSVEVARAATRAKLIQVPWTGVDRLAVGLGEVGIPICNSHSNAEAVAEYATTLVLAALKGIVAHDRALRVGEWRRPGSDQPISPPRRVKGSVVSVVGFGSIGARVAEQLTALGVHVLAVVREARASESGASIEFVSDLGDALERSDAVVLALPLTDQTRGLIDSRAISRLRTDAFLVNVARGEIVDEASLFDALRSRRIGGAAIDTWWTAPSGKELRLPSAKFPFHELDNCVLSPHRAGFLAGEQPHLADAAVNFSRVARGLAPLHQVDVRRGY